MQTQNDISRPRRRGRSIVGPLLLITLGVLLLLNTLNVLPWSIWEVVWRFWPVALILIGLELVLGRGNPWASGALVVIAAVVLVPLAFFAAFFPIGWFTLTPASVATSDQRVEAPLQGAREASLRVTFAAGSLYLGAMSNADTANLVEGDVRRATGSVVVEQAFTPGNERTEVTLRRASGVPVGVNNRTEAERWTLNVNPAVPLDLRVEGGAAEANLDLRGLKVRNLAVEMGASSTRVTLPEGAGFTRATFRSGMADLRVDVPEGVAARIVSRSGLGSVEVDERRFPKTGNVYQSPDYDTAANKVEIDLEAGMASIKVR